MSEFNQDPILPAASSSGLADNVAAALAYVTIIPAILFLVLEPYNRNPLIRFHAFQSLGLGITWIVCSMLMIIPLLGWILAPILMLILFVVWVICIMKAYQGKMFKVPVIGNIVENMAK